MKKGGDIQRMESLKKPEQEQENEEISIINSTNLLSKEENVELVVACLVSWPSRF